MGLLRVHFNSKVLRMMSTIDAVIPEKALEGNGPIPVLWLLHGGAGTHSDWHRFTNVERYASDKGIALVMPSAGISRYCDMTYGGDYYTYIVEELPAAVRHFFPLLSAERKQNSIAGLSLGGSGAISLGIRNPERYSAIGVFSASSIIPLEYLRAASAGGPQPPGGPGRKSVNMLNFGVEDTGELKGTEHDVLMHAKDNVVQGKPLPRIFHAVGTEDHAYPVGLGLKAFFESFEGNPYRYEFHEEPGAHNWDFWDKWVRVFLDWLKPEKEGV